MTDNNIEIKERRMKFAGHDVTDLADRYGTPLYLMDEYASFEREIEKDEQKAMLNKALSALKDDYKTALHLVYFEELSYADAAKVMKKSPKQIENILYRARQSLRSELEKEGFVYEE